MSLVGDELAIRNFGTVRAAKLLAILSLSRTGRMPRTQLAELLWPDDFYDSTRLRLRQEIHRLKRMLGASSDLIGADANDVWLDRSRFRTDLEALEDAARGRHDAKYDYCLEGSFLPGWEDPWVVAERTRANKLQLQAAVAFGSEKLDHGDPAAALQLSRRLIARHPVHQELRMVAVNAHSKMGSVSAAVAEFQEYRREVRDRLGVEAAELDKDFLAEIAAESAAEPVAPEPISTDWSVTVPLPIDPIFGREDLVAQVLSRLANPTTRMVTLVGPGGVGKTRLVIEVARRLLDSGMIRVAFASLAEVTDPEEWPRAVLSHLKEDPPSEADPLKYLASLLKNASTVLIMDSLETILPAAKAGLEYLVAESRDLQIIATSVSPARTAQEVLIPVGPLDPKTAGRDFLAAALRAVRPQAAELPGVDEDLAKLAQELGGYPLSLRLVSARFRLLSPKAVLGQVGGALSDAGRGNLPERHRSLDNALQSSLASLSEPQRNALTRIAAYPGGLSMDLAAVEFEGEPYLDMIEALLDGALLFMEDQGGHVRVRMLAPIQHHVRAAVGEETWRGQEAVAARNILSFLDQFPIGPWRPLPPSVLLALDTEADNLIFAHAWALANLSEFSPILASKFMVYEAARGRASASLDQYPRLREHWATKAADQLGELDLGATFLTVASHREHEAHDFLARARSIAAETSDRSLLARVTVADAYYRFRVDFYNAEERGQEALALGEEVGDIYVAARAHKILASVANYKADYKKAIEHVAQSYRSLLQVENGTEAASTGVHYAGLLWSAGRGNEAHDILERSRETLAVTREPAAWAFVNEIEGRIALGSGRPADAEAYFRESLRIWQAVGTAYQEADQNHSLSLALIEQGHWAEARQTVFAAGDLWVKDKNMGGLCCTLTLVGRILLHDGDEEEAKKVMAFSLDFDKAHDLVLVEPERERRRALIEELGKLIPHEMPLTLETAHTFFRKIS